MRKSPFGRLAQIHAVLVAEFVRKILATVSALATERFSRSADRVPEGEALQYSVVGAERCAPGLNDGAQLLNSETFKTVFYLIFVRLLA